MKLFYYPGACSLVPHIALEEIGAPFDTRKVDFALGEQLSAEYLSVNPAGRVPALRTDRGVITEIPAILGFLARTFPESGLMSVTDHFEFARMQGFHMYIATTLHVLFRHISRPEFIIDGDEERRALVAKVPEMADHYFAPIEQRMADGRRWVHGDRYSASDIYLYVFASYLNLGDRGDPGKVPNIWAHRQRVRSRPAVDRALAREGGGMLSMAIFD
ncbi:MAG: glutathione S-transferase [Porticoccaceae bacterium]|nr:glutathione S-transferase [Porticoccaceae bacterium]